MKRFLFWFLPLLLCAHLAQAAETVLDKTATTTPASTDILYIVVDPTGTPLDRKVTVGNLAKGLGAVGLVTVTQPATAATLTIINNKIFTVNKTLTLDGTDGTTMIFPSTSATIARTDAANTFTGAQTFGSPVNAQFVTLGGRGDGGTVMGAGSEVGWSNDNNPLLGTVNTKLFRKAGNVVGVGAATGTTDGSFQGKYNSSDGTAGATTTCTIVGLTSITVKDGIITSCN